MVGNHHPSKIMIKEDKGISILFDTWWKLTGSQLVLLGCLLVRRKLVFGAAVWVHRGAGVNVCLPKGHKTCPKPIGHPLVLFGFRGPTPEIEVWSLVLENEMAHVVASRVYWQKSATRSCMWGLGILFPCGKLLLRPFRPSTHNPDIELSSQFSAPD